MKNSRNVARCLRALLLMFCFALASLSAHAMTVLYLGTENVTEETVDPQAASDDPDLLFSKKEPKIVGRREVMRGICKSGKAVKVMLSTEGWTVEGVSLPAEAKGASPTDLAFIACGEMPPKFGFAKAELKTQEGSVPQLLNGVVNPVLPAREYVAKPTKMSLSGECESFKQTTWACIAKTLDLFFLKS